MNMMFDARLFEDLNQQIPVLGELFSTKVPRSKDPQVNRMVSEARLYAFMSCHTTLSNLLRSIYDKSDMNKKEGSDPKNAIGEVLTGFYRNGVLSRDQISVFIDQFDAAPILSYDRTWLPGAAEQKLFQERYNKISRYYYAMSSFIAALSKKVSFMSRRPHDTES